MYNKMLNDCLFCEKILNISKKRVWYDFFVIKEFECFIIIVALGSIVPGYLLVVSKSHATSLAHLSKNEINEIKVIIKILNEKLGQYWMNPIVFEHGSGTLNGTSGNSISHVHLHVVPVIFENEFLDEYQKLNDLIQLKNYMGMDYQLYINSAGECFVRSKSNMPSQYFRRLIANSIGIPDKWNYKIYPFYNNMKKTIRLKNEF